MNIFSAVLPAVTMLLLGFFARKANLISEEGIRGMKSFVVTFTLPAVLFSALCTVDFTARVFLSAAAMFAACLAAFGLGRLAARFFSSGRDLIPFMTTGFEAGMMGYALFTMLFGSENIGFFAIVDLGQVVFVFTVYLGLLNAREGLSAGRTLKNLLHDPAFLAIAAGLLFSITGLGRLLFGTAAGSTILSIIDYIAAPTGAVILFTVGYSLSFSGSLVRSAAAAALARLVIMAGLCAAFIFVTRAVFSGNPLYREYIPKAALLMFSLPAPFVFPVYAKKEEDIRFSATFLSLYTLLSILLFALIAAYCGI